MRLYVAIMMAVTLAVAATAAVPPFTLALTQCKLLSGSGLGNCKPPYSDAKSCRRGIAEAAFMRRKHSPAATFIPYADTRDMFVQMHPELWGINAPVFRRFGATAFLHWHQLLTSKNWAGAQAASSSLNALVSNVRLSTANGWFSTTSPYVAVEINGSGGERVAYLNVRIDDDYDYGIEQPASAVAAVLRRLQPDASGAIPPGGARFTVVHFVPRHEYLLPDRFVEVLNENGAYPSAVLYIRRFTTDPTPPMFVNTTLVVEAHDSNKDIEFTTFIPATEVNTSRLANFSQLHVSLTLSDSERANATWQADQAYMDSLSAQAETNDPVVGATLTAMPATRDGSDLRLCFGGECPIGNLWTDSYRWAVKADFAFDMSGGIRGSGWPAGPVRMSHIYDALPFDNTVCTVTLRGLTVLRMLNYSVAHAEFMSTYTPSGDLLLQTSGLRYTYNTELPTNARLLAVDVMDNATGSWTPIDRLTLYRVAAPSFLCAVNQQYKPYFQAQLAGETTPVYTNDVAQVLLANYMTAVNPTPIGRFGRQVNDTTATAAQVLQYEQTAADCGPSEIFDLKIDTCHPCPPGFVVHNASRCVPEEPETSPNVVLFALLGGGFILLVLCGIGLATIVIMRLRRHRHCPQDPEAPYTAFFLSVKNEAAMAELAPDGMHVAFHHLERTVSKAASECGCYVARRLGAHLLVVALDDVRALRCITAIRTALRGAQWQPMMLRAERNNKNNTGSQGGLATPTPPRGAGLAESHSQRNESSNSDNNNGLHRTVRSFSFRSAMTGVSRFGGARSFRPPPDPEIAIGLYTGRGIVCYNEHADTFEYGGFPVDAAAALADMAGDGVNLTTSSVVNHVTGKPLAAKTFDSVTAQTISMNEDLFWEPIEGGRFRHDGDIVLGRGKKKVRHATARFVLLADEPNTLGHPGSDESQDLSSIEASTPSTVKGQLAAPGKSIMNRRKSKNANGIQIAGPLAAALEQAQSGLTARRIAALVVSFPHLRMVSGPHALHREELTAAVTKILGIASKVAATHKAHIHSFVDGYMVLTINASGPAVVQAPTRAGQTALHLITVLDSKAPEFPATVGFTHAPAVVGTVEGLSTVTGATVERARFLAMVADQYGDWPDSPAQDGDAIVDLAPPPAPSVAVLQALRGTPVRVLTTSALQHDLQIAFHLQSVDIIAWWPQAGGDPDAPAAIALQALMQESEAGAEDEWMYQLQGQQDENPYSDTNKVFEHVLAQQFQMAIDSAAQARETNAVIRGRAIANAVMKSRFGPPGTGVREYARHRANDLLAGFDPEDIVGRTTRRLGQPPAPAAVNGNHAAVDSSVGSSHSPHRRTLTPPPPPLDETMEMENI